MFGADHPDQTPQPGLLQVGSVGGQHGLGSAGHDVQARRLAPGAGIYEIPRIDVESWQEVGDQARREAVPLVIAGAVAESTAVRDWSPRGLARRFDYDGGRCPRPA